MLTILADRFECVQPLNVGTYFEAYCATDKVLDRSVFIKIARASGDPVAAKIVEAHVALWHRLAREKFRGSPTILDCGGDGGLIYLITEWIGSPSLRTLLDRDRRPIVDPSGFLRLLLTGGLSALAELHGRGFVHGDISPGNILADPWAKLPAVYLVDPAPQFDLPDPRDPTRRLILGNPHFCAPEVLAGQPVSARADLFALGTVIEEAARILGAVAPGLASRLSAARPEDRPASAEETLALLRDESTQGVNVSPTAGPASADAWTAVSAAVSVPIPRQVTEFLECADRPGASRRAVSFDRGSVGADHRDFGFRISHCGGSADRCAVGADITSGRQHGPDGDAVGAVASARRFLRCRSEADRAGPQLHCRSMGRAERQERRDAGGSHT